MSSDAQFTGSIPQFYDEGLGPIIFHPYADDISARAKKLKPTNVLELAAGTGIVTRYLRKALPKQTSIMATDLNDAMLDIARPHFKSRDNVSFEVVDAMSLPTKDNSQDLVLCQFGVMFFPDKIASYREVLRVLKPGKTYLLSAWDSWQGNPWAEMAQKTIESFFETDPPKFYEVPFHYNDHGVIKADLEAAGFMDVSVETVPMLGKITSHKVFAHAAIFGNPIADQVRALNTDITPEQVEAAVRQGLEESFGASPTSMPMAAIMISARKPDHKRGLFARLFDRLFSR